MEVLDSTQRSKQFVDPAVSKAKFDRELALFRELMDFNRLRGVCLIKSEFPIIEIVFLAYKVRPAVAVFTVRIDFTNYDVEPPSVQFIDPITAQPLRIHEIVTKFPRLAMSKVSAIDQNGVTSIVDIPGGQELLQSHAPNHIPFFCIPGVREYHEHPYHSNDPWLNHRRKGEGSLGFIIDQLHKYGTEPLVSVAPQSINIRDLGNGNMIFNFNGITLVPQPNLLPS